MRDLYLRMPTIARNLSADVENLFQCKIFVFRR
jgi:hypothetical protein